MTGSGKSARQIQFGSTPVRLSFCAPVDNSRKVCYNKRDLCDRFEMISFHQYKSNKKLLCPGGGRDTAMEEGFAFVRNFREEFRAHTEIKENYGKTNQQKCRRCRHKAICQKKEREQEHQRKDHQRGS